MPNIFCSDCGKPITIEEPSYHWAYKNINLCQVCGMKTKWNKEDRHEQRHQDEDPDGDN